MSIHRMEPPQPARITIDWPSDPVLRWTTDDANYMASVLLSRAVVHIDELRYVEAQSETRS